MLEVISKIRQEKSNAKKPMNAQIILTITKEDNSSLKLFLEDLKSVANASEIKEGSFNVKFVE